MVFLHLNLILSFQLELKDPRRFHWAHQWWANPLLLLLSRNIFWWLTTIWRCTFYWNWKFCFENKVHKPFFVLCLCLSYDGQNIIWWIKFEKYEAIEKAIVLLVYLQENIKREYNLDLFFISFVLSLKSNKRKLKIENVCVTLSVKCTVVVLVEYLRRKQILSDLEEKLLWGFGWQKTRLFLWSFIMKTTSIKCKQCKIE